MVAEAGFASLGWDSLPAPSSRSARAGRNGIEVASAISASSDDTSTATQAPRAVVNARSSPPSSGTAAVSPPSRATASTPRRTRAHTGPRQLMAAPPVTASNATPTEPPPNPVVRNIQRTPGMASAATGKTNGASANQRRPRPRPASLRASATPSNAPHTAPGRMMAAKVPVQSTVGASLICHM